MQEYETLVEIQGKMQRVLQQRLSLKQIQYFCNVVPRRGSTPSYFPGQLVDDEIDDLIVRRLALKRVYHLGEGVKVILTDKGDVVANFVLSLYKPKKPSFLERLKDRFKDRFKKTQPNAPVGQLEHSTRIATDIPAVRDWVVAESVSKRGGFGKLSKKYRPSRKEKDKHLDLVKKLSGVVDKDPWEADTNQTERVKQLMQESRKLQAFVRKRYYSWPPST